VRIGFDTSALDPRFKSHAERGIGRYVSNVARYLQENLPSDLAIEWFNHENLIASGVATKLIDLLPCARTTLRQQLLYPLKLSSGALKGTTCVHFPAHMDGPAWSTKPYILTVHDLIPLILEQLYRANRPTWRYEFARWLENRSIKNASLLLSVSETTAKDVVRLLGIPRERILVTPNGVDQGFFDLFRLRQELSEQARTELRTRLKVPLGRPIIFYVGGHDERKNIARLVEISREVISECADRREVEPVLVLAGRIALQRERDTLDTALRDFAMAADTVNVGFVSDADLRALYAESAVFLFPSLYEGFGLPVLEAMAAGVPVVSSDQGALPEVMGKAGLLFHPEDVIAGSQSVLQVLHNRELSTRLSHEGHQQAQNFTWERTGRLTVEAYRHAAQLLSTSKRSRQSARRSEFEASSINSEAPVSSAGNAE
jgi:glycosyltransferase involved in cell wall biosynthesis